MDKLFKSLLEIINFDSFLIETSSIEKKKKKKMFPDLKGKQSKNVIVKQSKSINQMDVDQAMEIHFSEDIMVDILIRLPVQSLLRFKCASKFWKTLISDPYFKSKHSNHAKNNKKFLIARRRVPEDCMVSYYCSSLSSAQPLQKFGCPSNHKRGDYMILCCCDGLSLLWCYAGFLLWNPSTNETEELSDYEFPNKGRCTFGLGYDSIRDEYKILVIDNSGKAHRRPNKILALKSGSWREIDYHPRGFGNNMRGNLAFVRGAFHWIYKDNLFKYFVISFNISNEVYGEISLPEGICNISDRYYVKRGVSVLEGMLCAYCTYLERGVGTFKLWVMKDYGVEESWTELFTIREPHLFLAIPKYMFADGEVLLYYEEGFRRRGFRTSKRPFELLPAGRHTLLQGFIYTESLISPKLLSIS